MWKASYSIALSERRRGIERVLCKSSGKKHGFGWSFIRHLQTWEGGIKLYKFCQIPKHFPHLFRPNARFTLAYSLINICSVTNDPSNLVAENKKRLIFPMILRVCWLVVHLHLSGQDWMGWDATCTWLGLTWVSGDSPQGAGPGSFTYQRIATPMDKHFSRFSCIMHAIISLAKPNPNRGFANKSQYVDLNWMLTRANC